MRSSRSGCRASCRVILAAMVAVSAGTVLADPIVHYKLDGDLVNSGTGGSSYDADFVDTDDDDTREYKYVTGACCATGQGLSLAGNPQSTSTGGTYVNTNYVPGESGTIALWYKPTTFYNYQSILDNNTTSSEDWEFWIYADGIARFRTRGGNVSYDLDNLGGANQWYHLALTWDRQDADSTKADIQLYVDGELRQSNTSTWVDPNNVFLAGGHIGNNYGLGVWDDVRMYDYVLSGAEISALVIPEPSALMLLAFAVLSFVFRRRRSVS